MGNLQLVLTGGNGQGTDLSLCWSAEDRAHYLFLGLALIQRLPGDRAHVLHKLAVAQLVNAGFALRQLAREFHHAPATMTKWAEAVLTGDLEIMAAAFAGQGAERKLLPDMEEFVRGQYLALRDVYPDFRKRIAAGVLKRFGQRISGERLRQVFRQVDRESGGPGCPAADPEDVSLEHGCASDSCGSPTADSVPEPTARPAPSPRPYADTESCPVERGVPGQAHVDSSTVAVPVSVATKRCAHRSVPSTDMSTARKHSCAPAAEPAPRRVGLPLSGFDPLGQSFVLHHAGQVLFSPFLDVLGAGADEQWSMHQQWLVQILQGAVNIEQSKRLCASSLSLLCGPCGAGRGAQRRALKRQADPDVALALFGAPREQETSRWSYGRKHPTRRGCVSASSASWT